MFGLRGCLLVCVVLVGGMFLSRDVVGADLYWPSAGEWETVEVEAAGFDVKLLEAASARAERSQSRGLLIVRGGRIVLERYWRGSRVDAPNDVFEVHLGMLGVLTQMAVERGEFASLDKPMADFIESWAGTKKEGITVRHLMEMTSGLSSDRYRAYDIDGDQFKINARMPMRQEAGVFHRDNLPGAQLLYGVIKKTTGQNVEVNATRRLFDPLEMGPVPWSKDAWHDGTDAIVNFYRPIMTMRQMGRFGLFMLRDGVWKGERLVKSDYLVAARTATDATLEDDVQYGMFCELNMGWGFDVVPADLVVYRGYGEKMIAVIPSLDLMIVRTGGFSRDRVLLTELLSMVCLAIRTPE